MTGPADPGRGREVAGAFAAAMQEVLTAVEASGRGRAVSEVEDALVLEMRARGALFMVPSEIKILARGVAEPGWPEREPGALEELLAAAQEETREESKFVQRADRSLDTLQARLDRCRGIRSFTAGYHRTMNGFEFEVCIEPWSSRFERKVRRRAGRIQIVVRPLNPDRRSAR